MGLKEWFGIKNIEPKVEEQQSCFYIDEADVAMMKAAKVDSGFKGEVEQKKVKFPQELGEDHPFVFTLCEGMYEKYGLVTAIIDKYVDFVVGPGFYIECEDERAKTIIEQFMQDVNLDTLLRKWIREALIKGNGFLELGGGQNESILGMKCLNANWMYVDRDEKGNVLKYRQYTGGFKKFDKIKVIPFESYQIAHLPLNVIGDNAYGNGIIYSALKLINYLLQNQDNLHMLMDRKANSPYDISIGKVIEGKYHKPSEASIRNLGKDLEWLHNKHEWVHDAMIEIKALDFGNIGEKFSFVMDNDLEILFYAFQIPAVVMGKANVPEGLAGVQMDAWERRINSIQAEVEKVIENQIFKRVLNANGLDVHVEFQWGRPSAQEKLDRMLRLTELMKIPAISQSFFKLMEADLVKMLDYDENEYETMSKEEELRRELERKQALVPGQNMNKPQLPIPEEEKLELIEYVPPESGDAPQGVKDILARVYADLRSGGMKDKTKASKIAWGAVHKAGWRKVNGKWIKRKENYESEKLCPHCNENVENINDINEWLGFRYNDYIKQIVNFVKTDEFVNLKAENDIEESAGYFSQTQVDTLKDVLNNGFNKGESIKDIALNIDKKVKPGDLYEIIDNKIGDLIKKGDSRSIMIARTEITRVSNEGALQQYRDGGVEQIRWVASAGDRTCDICNELNGQIFEINNHPEFPRHINCRCATLPITEIIR